LQGILKEASNQIGLLGTIKCLSERIWFRMLVNFKSATSVTKNEPALEPPKNRFDKRANRLTLREG
jgi:hypothetical protein